MENQADLNSLEKMFVMTTKDSIKPETNKNYLRLYGHNLCPFVEKARIALNAKQIQFQICEIDMQEKA